MVNVPLITTLTYCCFYHYSEPEVSWSQSGVKAHRLTGLFVARATSAVR